MVHKISVLYFKLAITCLIVSKGQWQNHSNLFSAKVSTLDESKIMSVSVESTNCSRGIFE